MNRLKSTTFFVSTTNQFQFAGGPTSGESIVNIISGESLSRTNRGSNGITTIRRAVPWIKFGRAPLLVAISNLFESELILSPINFDFGVDVFQFVAARRPSTHIDKK
jgi:hypothetical protein